MARLVAIFAALALLLGCTPEPEGRWTGGCATADPLRLVLDLQVAQTDDRPYLASLVVHQLSRDAVFAEVDCAGIEVAGAQVAIDECAGSWPPDGPGAFPLALDGQLSRGDPTDVLAGTCVYDGESAALELWRTP